MTEFAPILILALTATCGDEAERSCLEAVCTGHLAKSVDSAELFSTLSTHLKS